MNEEPISNQIIEAAQTFIKRIGDPARRGKRVQLLLGNQIKSPCDREWIKGALSTTALRRVPDGIEPPNGGLGFVEANNCATEVAENFVQELRRGNNGNYTEILLQCCNDLTDRVGNSTDLHWTFGRSQKFFNILCKYWFCVAAGYGGRLSEENKNLIETYSDSFHAPIDSVTLRHIVNLGNASLVQRVYWGWNLTEEKYLSIQSFLSGRAQQKEISTIAYELVEIW